ncbi:MAG TPA: hypothetical protein VHM89_12750 [Acidimicrobiales bacterium]|nr:hypothetical protein [Acidimicrobiales bacterium]
MAPPPAMVDPPLPELEATEPEQAAPPAPERVTAPETESTDDGAEEWSGIAEHPWWESAPAPEPERVVFEEPPTRVEPAVAQRPAERPPAPSPARSTARAPSRPAPTPESYSSARTTVRSSAAPPEASHRVRSAFGLLGVAVSVGVIVAGLITIAIFAVSLALRRAVG